MAIVYDAIEIKYKDQGLANKKYNMNKLIIEFILKQDGFNLEYHQFKSFTETEKGIRKPDGNEFEYAIGYLNRNAEKGNNRKKATITKTASPEDSTMDIDEDASYSEEV